MEKKTLRIFAVLLLTVLLAGCAGEPQSTVPTDPLTLAMTNKLHAADVNALPVSHGDMTKDELRQLCMDYFYMQLSFHWTSNLAVTDYPTTYSDSKKSLDMDMVYSGIPYQSTGTGNLYRWLEYYDELTGVFDMARAKAENGADAKTNVETDSTGKEIYYRYRWMRAMFNQCSVASFWGWGRVINSANFAWTSEMNVYNGFIPVGGFTYGYTHNGTYYGHETIEKFGEKIVSNPLGYDTKNVISDWRKAHGDDAMYKCYAEMKPADCLVSGGHAMMVRSVNLVYEDDGTIDPLRSYAEVMEQTEGFMIQPDIGEEKIPHKMQGRNRRFYPFETLQSSNYIPFTFAEFLEEDDPRLKTFKTSVAAQYDVFADKIDVSSGTGVEKAEVYVSAEVGEQLAFSELQQLTVGSNYPISDVFVTVTNKKGEALLTNIYRADTAGCREVSMGAEKCTWETANGKVLRLYDGLKPLADGSNTVTVTLQLSTGEKKEAFRCVLTA